MIRSFRFDNDDRELTVSELDDHHGVEVRVGGLPFVFDADEWIAFAKLAAGTLSAYGDHDLLVDLGRRCASCEGAGEHEDAASLETDPCFTCKGRGWMPGEPEPKKKAPAKTTDSDDERPF